MVCPAIALYTVQCRALQCTVKDIAILHYNILLIHESWHYKAMKAVKAMWNAIHQQFRKKQDIKKYTQNYDCIVWSAYQIVWGYRP